MESLRDGILREAARTGLDLEGLVSGEGGQTATAASLKIPRGRSGLWRPDPAGEICVTVSGRGFHAGGGWAPDLGSAARAVAAWRSGTSFTRLAEDFPFLTFDPVSEGHERGDAVAVAWESMLARLPHTRLGDPDITRAAYAEPRLRALFPFPSHGQFHFLRNTIAPHTGGLPFITGGGEGGLKVHTADYKLLGEPSTAEEAAALVVAHLPDDCGPAFEGTLGDPALNSYL